MSQRPSNDLSYAVSSMITGTIQRQLGRFYYFLGRVSHWVPGDTASITDVPPQTSVETARSNFETRSEIVYVHQVPPSDILNVTRRVNWVSGTHYDHWDDTVVMNNRNFYVVTLNNRVYKCLDNGANFGSQNPSTVMPNLTSLYPFTTADGYVWKFMYSLPEFIMSKFGSPSHLPVKTALGDAFFNNGAVTAVAILNQGSNYNDQLLTGISVSNAGATTGSGATATLTVNAQGTITAVTVTNGGTGYTRGARVRVNTATGIGAELVPVINVAGVITSITIVQGGVGYIAANTISITVGGAVLVPSVSRVTGAIQRVNIIDPGIGYLTAPALTVTRGTLAGTGAFGNPDAMVQAVVWDGSIRIVNILDPGINYATDAATTITVQGDGTGASFSPVIFQGRIVDVITENAGSGYTSIVLTVSTIGGNPGTGAILRGVVEQGDFSSNQHIVEQTAIPGAIHKVVITAPGINYSSQSTITIIGDGVGATAEPVISGGRIVRVRVLTHGRNYTHARAVINDPARPTIPVGELASAYAVLPPIGGHGVNATLELFSDEVSVNTSLRGALERRGINQNYRSYGILMNPTFISSTSFFSGIEELLAHRCIIQGSTAHVRKDDIYIAGNNLRFRVLEVTAEHVFIFPLFPTIGIPLGTYEHETLGATNTFVVQQVLTSYDFNKFSGLLVYSSNEIPFEFSETQNLVIRTFLKF